MAAECSTISDFKEPNRLEAALQAFVRRVFVRSYYSKYVESLGLSGNEKILEYGSGSGSASKCLARALLDGHLTCLDISQVWMGYAKKATRKFSNVDYLQGDIADLRIPDASYDAVFIHYMLHDIPPGIRQEKSKILLSKLKKGGKAFVREPTGENHGMAAEEIRAIMTANGLREAGSSTGKGPRGWPTFQGVYVK
jgi:ubiquinone/menaquinone biosynthesis C-methylase UbiE